MNVPSRGLIAHYRGILKWDASNLSWKIICELSTPPERAPFELLNVTFLFDLGPSYLGLYPVEGNIRFQPKTALGYVKVLGNVIFRSQK